MPRNLFDLSKILPVSLEKAKKYMRCVHLWKAISPLPEKDMKFEFLDEEKKHIHQEIDYTFIIGLTGLIKHTVHIEQDLLLEEKEDNTFVLTVEKSNEVAKSEILIKIEDMGDQINVEVSLIQLYLKSGVLELVGRRLVVNRFRGEIRKLLKKTASMLRQGTLDQIFSKCDEESV